MTIAQSTGGERIVFLAGENVSESRSRKSIHFSDCSLWYRTLKLDLHKRN